MLTKDEIRLIAFVLLALCLGTFAQWWRGRAAMPEFPPAKAEPRRGWAQPPYVFKSHRELEKVKESLEPNPAPR